MKFNRNVAKTGKHIFKLKFSFIRRHLFLNLLENLIKRIIGCKREALRNVLSIFYNFKSKSSLILILVREFQY